MRIKIYSKTNCPNCVKMKHILDRHSITYEEISLDDDIIRLEFLEKYPNAKSVPYFELVNKLEDVSDHGDMAYLCKIL